MSTKIFVVLPLDYTDLSVYGCFSSYEKAEAYINKSLDYYIHECELDEFADWVVGREAWRCEMNLQTGIIISDRASPGPETAPQNARGRVMLMVAWHNEKAVPVAEVVSFISQAHAHNLAVEARQAWLGQGPWTDFESDGVRFTMNAPCAATRQTSKEAL